MSKPSSSSLLNKINLDEEWSNHPAIEWLSSHKQIIIWTFLGLVALLILSYRLISVQTVNAERDFFQAQATFTQFQQANATTQDDPSTAADLELLITLMQRHPELKAKYEGPLAQTLLIRGEALKAQPFVDDVFTRTHPDHLQLYQNYSKVSLLIGQGQYAEALQQTQQLQQTLETTTDSTYPFLSTFNLLRLALLYQQVNQPQKELETWEKFQSQPQYVEATEAINQALKVGQASLNQYIAERRKVLTS
jgi:tetratricopeptide (TPR) repeat protein